MTANKSTGPRLYVPRRRKVPDSIPSDLAYPGVSMPRRLLTEEDIKILYGGRRYDDRDEPGLTLAARGPRG